jgi:hypothetical protein
MTGKQGDYDPLAYGQIRLQGDARGGKQRPEDILFEDSGQGPDPHAPGFGSSGPAFQAPATDRSRPDEFGLDSQSCLLSMPTDLGTGTTGPGPARAGAHPPPARSIGSGPSLRDASFAAAKPGREVLLRRHSVQAPRRRGSTLATFMPALLLASGAAMSAGLYLTGQGMVLAGTVAALGVVGAAFTWVWLRG